MSEQLQDHNFESNSIKETVLEANVSITLDPMQMRDHMSAFVEREIHPVLNRMRRQLLVDYDPRQVLH